MQVLERDTHIHTLSLCFKISVASQCATFLPVYEQYLAAQQRLLDANKTLKRVKLAKLGQIRTALVNKRPYRTLEVITHN